MNSIYLPSLTSFPDPTSLIIYPTFCLISLWTTYLSFIILFHHSTKFNSELQSSPAERGNQITHLWKYSITPPNLKVNDILHLLNVRSRCHFSAPIPWLELFFTGFELDSSPEWIWDPYPISVDISYHPIYVQSEPCTWPAERKIHIPYLPHILRE